MFQSVMKKIVFKFF